jgi:four helix bundle protein
MTQEPRQPGAEPEPGPDGKPPEQGKTDGNSAAKAQGKAKGGNGGTDERQYDLEERTAKFGEAVVAFCKTLPRDAVTAPLIAQLVRSGTSVGANYAEADDAESRRDFKHKVGLCRKEARESKHWLRMMAVATPDHKAGARRLWKEAKELHLIFAAIVRNTRTD